MCMNKSYQETIFIFAAPDVSNIEPIATKPGEHIQTQNTITLEINVEYFRNNLNGIQVLFGIAVCAEFRCKGEVSNSIYSLFITIFSNIVSLHGFTLFCKIFSLPSSCKIWKTIPENLNYIF